MKAESSKRKIQRVRVKGSEANGKAGGRLGSRLAKAAAAVVMLALVGVAGFYSYRQFAATPLEISGQTITVRRGGNFQAALERARPGDTILLEKGATFKGAFKLPKKDGAEFITIRSTAADAELPPAGTRLDPQKHLAALARLESDVKGEPVILAAGGAHHYRFVGLEFAPTIEGLYNIIQIGTAEEKSEAELAHHIEFDRVWIHGDKRHGQRRGIAANGRHIKVENSYISDIMRRGEESQGIAAWSSDGPIEIVNNYIEAAAENILFGGAASSLKLIPTDCLVAYNHLNKPLEWRDRDWVVKNLFEIKNGRRIKVENNLMTNNWAMGQDGIAIQITTRADSGPTDTIEDVELRNNIIRGAAGAVAVLGNEGAGGHRLTIENNLFADIDGPGWGGAGHFLKATDWNGLRVANNTIVQTGNITLAYGGPVKNFVFEGNIVFHNEYGFLGDGVGSGKAAVDKYFPGASISHNAVIGKGLDFGRSNVKIEALHAIGFAAPEKGDYQLRPNNPLLTKGLKGGRIGAKLDGLKIGAKN